MPNKLLLQGWSCVPPEFRPMVDKKFGYSKLAHYNSYRRGSVKWLRAAEKHFGASIDISTLPHPINVGHGHVIIHGDRMFNENDALTYSKYLQRFLNKENLVIVETNFVHGLDLALWSVLFPTADIFGFDDDTFNFLHENLDFFKSKGAFKNKVPSVFKFAQLTDSFQLKDILGGRKIDILIDYTSNSTINMLELAYPLLNREHVCFVEKNIPLIAEIEKKHFNSIVHECGELAVIENK